MLFLTLYFYYLPQAVLGAILIVSILPMVELNNIRQCWQFNRADATSLLVAFANTFLLGVDWHQYGASSFALNGATILAANGATILAANGATLFAP